METPTPVPPLRLVNQYPDIPPIYKVSAYISKADFEYLFCHFLAGPKGSCQAIISTFFAKLCQHMREDLKIPQVYDEDGKTKMAEILSRLNFNERTPIPSSISQRTPSRRRPARGPAVHQGQPASGDSQ